MPCLGKLLLFSCPVMFLGALLVCLRRRSKVHVSVDHLLVFRHVLLRGRHRHVGHVKGGVLAAKHRLLARRRLLLHLHLLHLLLLLHLREHGLTII